VTSGILLLDKPPGVSSNAALQRVKHLLGARKAGHVGSLDPLATGMLPICLDEATKVAGEILSGRKCYRFTIRLGVRTATGDAEGAVVETAPVPSLAAAALEQALQRFTGPQSQVPPMYSALKVEGQPLYKLARAGLDVPRAGRAIHIHDLQLVQREEHSLQLSVLCSKGTYVRVLAEDIARNLGTCGHVTELRRLYVEPFTEAAMLTLESISGLTGKGLRPELLPADAPLQHMPAVHLDPTSVERLFKGQAVQREDAPVAGRVRLYDSASQFIGLGESNGAGRIQPKRMLIFE